MGLRYSLRVWIKVIGYLPLNITFRANWDLFSCWTFFTCSSRVEWLTDFDTKDAKWSVTKWVTNVIRTCCLRIFCLTWTAGRQISITYEVRYIFIFPSFCTSFWIICVVWKNSHPHYICIWLYVKKPRNLQLEFFVHISIRVGLGHFFCGFTILWQVSTFIW